MELQLSNPVLFARSLRCLQELNDTALLEISSTGLYFQVMDDAKISMATYELEGGKLRQYQFLLENNITVNVPLKPLCNILFSMTSHDLLTMRILPPFDEISFRNDFDSVQSQQQNSLTEENTSQSSLLVEPSGSAYGTWILKLCNDSQEGAEKRVHIPPFDYPVAVLFPTDLLKDIIATYERSNTSSITFTVDYDTKSIEISPAGEDEESNFGNNGPSDSYKGGVIRLNTRPDSPSAVVLNFFDKPIVEHQKLRFSLGTHLMKSLGKLKDVTSKNWVYLHEEKEIKVQCPIGDMGNLELYLAQVCP